MGTRDTPSQIEASKAPLSRATVYFAKQCDDRSFAVAVFEETDESSAPIGGRIPEIEADCQRDS